MENPHQDDTLIITLSNSGAATLKRLASSTRILFLIGCVVSLLELTATYLRYSTVSLKEYKSNILLYTQLALSPFYIIIYLGFLLLQIFQFMKFTRLSNASVELGDSESFNRSLNFLQKYNTIGIINFSMGLFMLILNLVVELQYFSTKN